MSKQLISNKLIIATRKSPLALWQAECVRQELLKYHSNLQIELLKLSTDGDRFLDTSLQKIGGKGLFVKELEQALINKQADIAVHSLKDVPYDLPDGLCLSTILKSETPFDAFVSNNYQHLHGLPLRATVGTSSLRRKCQLLLIRPDLNIVPLRGNVQTRLKKLDDGLFDAIILAAAGLKRLGFHDRISYIFSNYELLPAIGQGVLAIETREDDKNIQTLLSPLEDKITRIRITAERAFNRQLEGGCHIPVGAFAEIYDAELNLTGFLGNTTQISGSRASICGPFSQAENLGIQLAELLKNYRHEI